jgi:hypothetical protein
MRNLLIIARQTFTECLRTRLFVAFAIALGAVLPYLALTVEGDGSPAGRIKTFLAYGLAAVQILLGAMTIFLTTGIITSDVRRKTIFTVITKPLKRWQYLLGRWMGVVAVNLALLAPAMGLVYGLCGHLRGVPTAVERAVAAGALPEEALEGDRQRMAVDREVWTARRVVRPDPFDAHREVVNWIKRLREEGEYENLLKRAIREKVRAEEQAEMRQKANRLARRAIDRDDQQLREQAQDLRAAADRLAIDQGRVDALYADQRYRANVERTLIEEAANNLLAERMMVDPGDRPLWITFSNIEPPAGGVLQLRYKLQPTPRPDSGLVESQWLLRKPDAPLRVKFQTDSAEAASTVNVPAEMVHEGTLTVGYVNDPKNEMPIKVDPRELRLLVPEGTFEGNVLRGGVLLLVKMGFLAGAAVFFASCLSFPVACLASLVTLALGMMQPFVVESTQLSGTAGTVTADFWGHVSHALGRGVYFLLPDFAGTNPTDALVDGALISWSHVAVVGVLDTGLRALIAVGLGCLIFWRRELARVQV